MRSDLLLSTQSFIDTFSAPNYAERSKSIAKSTASSTTELKQSKSDESFEAFMNDLKARQAAERSQNNAASNNENAQNADTKKEVKTKPINPFLTQIANTSLAEENISDDDIVFDIYTQMEEIIQELERLMAAQDKTEQNTLTTEIPEDDLLSLKDLTILSLFARVIEDADASSNDQTMQNPEDTLTQAMSDLREIIEGNKESLITLNKSPEELAELQKIIEDILKAQIDKHNQKMLEELAAQWATIEIVKTEANQSIQQSLAQNENTAIISEQSSLAQNSELNSRYDDRYQINRYTKDSQSDPTSDSLTNSTGKETKDMTAAPINNKVTENPTQHNNKSELIFAKLLSEQTSLTPLPIMTAQGDLLYTDQSGTVITAATGNNTQPSLINNAAHSSHASQPHPATHAVVTTITKAIKSRETSEIKIQLDPPELGRVEVKMSIDQDNITKVVLTSEKAETHTLLQRDSHILQQLLTDSGLLPDGSSLSFELSDGNAQNFSSNKEQNGQAAGKEDTYSEIIESTMDWKVDPRTGVMHYNILA